MRASHRNPGAVFKRNCDEKLSSQKPRLSALVPLRNSNSDETDTSNRQSTKVLLTSGSTRWLTPNRHSAYADSQSVRPPTRQNHLDSRSQLRSPNPFRIPRLAVLQVSFTIRRTLLCNSTSRGTPSPSHPEGRGSSRNFSTFELAHVSDHRIPNGSKAQRIISQPKQRRQTARAAVA